MTQANTNANSSAALNLDALFSKVSKSQGALLFRRFPVEVKDFYGSYQMYLEVLKWYCSEAPLDLSLNEHQLVNYLYLYIKRRVYQDLDPVYNLGLIKRTSKKTGEKYAPNGADKRSKSLPTVEEDDGEKVVDVEAPQPEEKLLTADELAEFVERARQAIIKRDANRSKQQKPLLAYFEELLASGWSSKEAGARLGGSRAYWCTKKRACEEIIKAELGSKYQDLLK